MQINKVLFDVETQEKLRVRLHSGELTNGKICLFLAWYAGLSATDITQLKWTDIDYENRILHISERDVPFSEELSKLLLDAEQEGVYVVYSRKAKNKPTTRKNVTWLARTELDAAGFPDITLKDLRGLYITKAIKKFPIKKAARISRIEMQGIHKLIKDNYPEIPLAKPTTNPVSWDARKFKMALEKEGDTLDTRIVWLCWQGGLSLQEMPYLYWENISFEQQTWQICGTCSRIPSKEMCERIQKWELPENRIGPVLRGKISEKQIDPIFVTKRGEEFLIRNGFDTFTFLSIRGDYNTPPAHELSDTILEAIEIKKIMSEAQLTREIGAPKRNVHKCLQELVEGGKLRYSEMEKRYLLPDIRTNKENIYDIIEEYRTVKTPLTTNEVATRLGLPKNLIYYYFQRAWEQGVIQKIGTGTYLCI